MESQWEKSQNENGKFFEAKFQRNWTSNWKFILRIETELNGTEIIFKIIEISEMKGIEFKIFN